MRQLARQVPGVLLHPLLANDDILELRVLAVLRRDPRDLGDLAVLLARPRGLFADAFAHPGAPAGHGGVDDLVVLLLGELGFFFAEGRVEDVVAREGAAREFGVAQGDGLGGGVIFSIVVVAVVLVVV